MAKQQDPAATPLMRQYLTAKEKHKDALLFFRLGDFYELFFEDAVIAARALELTLTSRNKGAEDEIPMAGVPYHAAATYIQRLLDQGFKVAICEQMADPSKVKGIVPREVVRVVTPAIVYDDATIDARTNLYLVAVEEGAGRFGIAALDVSTGELSACEAADRDGALGELVRLDARELLVGPGAEAVAEQFAAVRPRAVVRKQAAALEEAAAMATLDAILGAGEAGASGAPISALRAAARCLDVARECEAGQKPPVARLEVYGLDETLLLDDATQSHLELVRTMDGDTRGSLLAQIDETKTGPGARLLRRRLLSPLTHVSEIRRRHDAVELFVTQPGLRAEVRSLFGRVSDIERLAMKLAVGRASPRDLVALGRSLEALPAVAHALESCPDLSAREALGIAPGAPWLDVCADLCDELVRAIDPDAPVRASDGGVIRAGYDLALDEVRTLARDGQRLIVELETRLREEVQIPSLKLRFTRVFGWYVEVTRSHTSKAPKTWRRKQTVANAERFTCDELDELADKLAHAEDRCMARETELLNGVLRSLVAHVERLRAVAGRLAEWDVASALAEVAHRNDYARPVVDDSLRLVIEDGRHPVVERLAAAGRFVPNDVALDATAERLWLLTGPNMAGKSTLMRQVALIVILAQAGSFVPARRAEVGIVDRVLTRVGASDNLAKGDSTFMVEMKETANVLRRATRRSLVVLDEIGRGTSTYDGLSIAWAVAEHLHDVIGCRAMFATHYHELTELCTTRSGSENFSVSAREHEGTLIFLHKLQRGAASRSYGVACARLAGIPEIVLARARTLLSDLERGAPLPSGAPASLRRRDRAARPQLDLFGSGPDRAAMTPEQKTAHDIAEALRSLDTDRLTPLEALQLVATWKKQVASPA
ncbi:DNA mismatch repair protein MutS [Pendulispora albinea]|uniref:DNA mismatch repair protein MutS n=1 Tax=Pendulispora albinea TaxID=2741071 RepID=A0ABZ2LVZ6_9BACT